MPTRAFLTVLLVAGIASQELPPSTLTYGAFAFPDPGGRELIVTHDVGKPEVLRSAICTGDVTPIAFARRQKDGRGSRQHPNFFAQLSGTVFRVAKGGLKPDEACLLVPDSLLAGAEILKTTPMPEPVPCVETDRRRVAAIRERPVQNCWLVARIAVGGQIAIVEYVRQGTDAFASLVIEVAGRPLTIDWRAKFEREGDDLWHLDDAGVFHPEDYGVPFLLRRGGDFVIAVQNFTGEGVWHSVHLAAERSAATRKVQTEYWYRAPL